MLQVGGNKQFLISNLSVLFSRHPSEFSRASANKHVKTKWRLRSQYCCTAAMISSGTRNCTKRCRESSQSYEATACQEQNSSRRCRAGNLETLLPYIGRSGVCVEAVLVQSVDVSLIESVGTGGEMSPWNKDLMCVVHNTFQKRNTNILSATSSHHPAKSTPQPAQVSTGSTQPPSHTKASFTATPEQHAQNP